MAWDDTPPDTDIKTQAPPASGGWDSAPPDEDLRGSKSVGDFGMNVLKNAGRMINPVNMAKGFGESIKTGALDYPKEATDTLAQVVGNTVAGQPIGQTPMATRAAGVAASEPVQKPLDYAYKNPLDAAAMVATPFQAFAPESAVSAAETPSPIRDRLEANATSGALDLGAFGVKKLAKGNENPETAVLKINEKLQKLLPDTVGYTDTAASKFNKLKVAHDQAGKMIGDVVDKMTASNDLPVTQPGAKTGGPHALFAYNDKFGPGGTERSVYNVFGDPEHPSVKSVGWGSSVPATDLEKAGIPIKGRQPNSTQYTPIQSGATSLPEADEAIGELKQAASKYNELSSSRNVDAKAELLDAATKLEGLKKAGQLNFKTLSELKSDIGSAYHNPNLQNHGIDQAYGILSDKIDAILERASVKDKTIKPQFDKAKEVYHLTSQLMPAMRRGVSREVAGTGGGLSNAAIGAGAIFGHPIAAGVGYAGKTALKLAAPDLMTNLAYKTMNAARGAPSVPKPGIGTMNLNELNDFLTKKYEKKENQDQ